MGRLLIGIVFLAALVAAPPAHAAQINVNTTVDELNNDGDCSLREAVKSAKDDLSPDACEPGLGADTIIVPAGTYNLLSQLIIQDNEVTVDGAGQASTIIAGGNVSVIGPAVPDPVWIQDLTVRDSPGTGILNSGHLTLDHVTATANGFSGVSGANTILDSSIDANSGSGISGGDIVIMNSTVRDNGGLGVQIGGNATITGSTISGNEDVGILNFNALIVTDSTISGNTSDFGGGIRNFAVDSQTATITLDGVTVSGNSATGGGGGIASVGGGVSNVTISESTIAGNQAPGGGGIAGQGTTTIENSTISGNSATAGEGGGISNGSGAPTSVMTVTNSTVSGNDATGEGGGILSGATTSLNFTTVADNTTTTGGGGLNVGGGAGGIPVTLHGTILADNTGPHEDCFGAVTSQGYNLIESGAACEPIGGDTTGNVLGQDPLLDPLANSGGPTETHALMTLGSAALNSGGPSCPATDQRGVLRPQGAGCDMGAFEREAPPETTITSGLGEGATISNPSPSFGFSSVEPGATFECKVDS
ncbi:MAG: choice-of-anchor Q domain-containing protein, partial [Solirubrobacterales bacterium]